MWWRFLIILPLVVSAFSIRVPVDDYEHNATEIIPVNEEQEQKTNVFYISDDGNVDSYLTPPDPHKPEILSEVITPATYLIPPLQERDSVYYIPTETGEQSEWLPILAQNRPETTYQRQPKITPIFLNPNVYQAEKPNGNIADENRFPLPVPSSYLQPPTIDAVNQYFVPTPETDSEDNQNQVILPTVKLPYSEINTNVPKFHINSVEPTIALHLLPPKIQVRKNPTNLYPKKYLGGFKPLPIPINQFAEENLAEAPKAKPAKYYKPLAIAETEQPPQSDEKKLYRYKKVEHQRKLIGEGEPLQPQQLEGDATEETDGGPVSSEQQTSETNFRNSGRDTYATPLRQALSPSAPRGSQPAAGPDGRTEFRMHGMKGPHSYQFGYDTGKGKNRQFRYEERDNDGLVSGHYGYMDRNGKLRIVNYSAHPEYGFHAEEPQQKP